MHKELDSSDQHKSDMSYDDTTDTVVEIMNKNSEATNYEMKDLVEKCRRRMKGTAFNREEKIKESIGRMKAMIWNRKKRVQRPKSTRLPTRALCQINSNSARFLLQSRDISKPEYAQYRSNLHSISQSHAKGEINNYEVEASKQIIHRYLSKPRYNTPPQRENVPPTLFPAIPGEMGNSRRKARLL